MRKLSYLLLIGLTGLSAQSITNVDFDVLPGNLIEVTYTIYDTEPDAVYIIDLWASLDGGYAYPIHARSVTGDVGQGVVGAGRKSILWKVLDDLPALVSDNLVIKVVGQPRLTIPGLFRSLLAGNRITKRLSNGITFYGGGGDYYFVKIQNGRAVGNFNGKIHVDSFSGDSLQASQILTARDIYSSPADSNKFKRFNLEVYPHPSRIFHPSEKMHAYQEIYNLIPDEDGTYNYRLTYTITLLKRDRNIFGKIFDSFKFMIGAGSAREQIVLAVEKKKAPVDYKMVHENVAIDVSDNPDGLYELSIRVEDLNNHSRTFQRNTVFFVRH